ncbi:hypothetical protein LOK49_LG14G00791 [Camellia lanceoleosa]|uniref:Uncharacterized protein n=1 Tax=Camellia lanceoleosa TaxID=1840588 RepID=A0ACC0FBK3_9ERIC|nr:hypothetical protein LOK49_LG14G00791 [Camellia lanceoleosa]
MFAQEPIEEVFKPKWLTYKSWHRKLYRVKWHIKYETWI